jgi:DNA-binding ferritin-like protein
MPQKQQRKSGDPFEASRRNGGKRSSQPLLHQNGAEEVPAMLSRLLEAHELIIVEAREAADKADQVGDQGTNDLLVSDVVRTNELQTWFVAEHLVDTPLVKA